MGIIFVCSCWLDGLFHLMSDVWTSAGVVAGLTAASLTGLDWLDPLIAILVGCKIGWEGTRILWRSTKGLMDTTIAPEERTQIEAILQRHFRRNKMDVVRSYDRDEIHAFSFR